MKTPRKRICFKTPKRPAPTNSINGNKSIHLSSTKSTRTKSTNIKPKLDYTNQQLIEAYSQENSFLRQLQHNPLLIKSIYGLEIKKIKENVNEYKQQIENRYIKFELEETEEGYVYRLRDFRDLQLPSYLMECISFTETQLIRFFFRVFEVVISKN